MLWSIPNWVARRIDLDPQLTDPGAVLADELTATDGEEWMRQAQSGRLIPRLMPLTAKVQPFAARPDAVYLISGGMGGIGRAVADWLVKRGARHLLLIGRHDPRVPGAACLGSARGAITTEAVDVADADALAEMLARLDHARLPLAGVFHVAGVTAVNYCSASLAGVCQRLACQGGRGACTASGDPGLAARRLRPVFFRYCPVWIGRNRRLRGGQCRAGFARP